MPQQIPNPFAGAFGGSVPDAERERMLQLLMGNQGPPPQMSPNPMQQQQQAPQMNPNPSVQPERELPLAAQMELNKMRREPVPGMAGLMDVRTGDPFSALAKALTARSLGKGEGKLRREEKKVFKKAALAELAKADKEQAYEYGRERRIDDLNRQNIESQIEARGKRKPPKTREIKRDQEIITEQWDEINEEWVEQETAPRFKDTSAIDLAQQDEYAKARQKQAADLISDQRKSADTAVVGRRKMDQFLAASALGREGGFQPVLNAVENLFTTFGYEAEDLKDEAVMQQAIQYVQANYMRELGARGLTDKDMQILAQTLPNVATSKEAREAVAAIMKKTYDYTINDYMGALDAEAETYPQLKIAKPTWYEGERQRYDIHMEKKRRGLL